MPLKDPEKRKLYIKRWREANLERVRKQNRIAVRKWRRANPERCHQNRVAWDKNHADYIRRYRAAWYKTNRERVLRLSAAWKKRNKYRRNGYAKAGCRRLADHYIAGLFRTTIAQLPPALIEAKRAQLLLLRETRRKS